MEENEIEYFNDPDVASRDAPVPLFLKLTYILLPIWGLITFYVFWNGSVGWLDRGYWHELQIAANTTYPIENQEDPHAIQKSADFSTQKSENVKNSSE